MSGAYGQCWAQNRQVRTHFCRERAGNLCEKTWKNAASQGQEWSIKRGEKMKNCCNPGVSREKKMNLNEPDDDDDDDHDDDDDDVGDDDHRGDDDVNKISIR